MWWLCGLLMGRKRCDFLWDHLLHVSAECFQTEMPQLQKRSHHLHSARATGCPTYHLKRKQLITLWHLVNSLHLNMYFEDNISLIKQCLLRLLLIQMSFLWMSLTQNDKIFLKLLRQSGKASCNLTAASATNGTFYRDLLTALSLCWVDSQVTDACQAPSRVILAEVWRFLFKKQHIL